MRDTYAHLRVLDLSSNFAGPLACQIFGDLGADVIKIERTIGEDTRNMPPFFGDESTVFRSVNRNKRSVALDLKDPAARDAVLRVGRTVDVVVESFRPGAADRLRLGYEDFRSANPAIIYCSISAFGSGPLGRSRPGYDALLQAFTGMMDMTGHPDSPPARHPAALIDLSTGLWATIAITAALARRADTGAGEHLEVALIDSGFHLLSHQLLGKLANGEVPSRFGSGGPSAVPYEAFEAADGWIMIAVANDPLFAQLADALELPALAADPRFSTAAARVENRDELRALLRERLASDTVAAWSKRFDAGGVPAAPVNDLRQAVDDPVTVERGILVSPADDAGAALPLLRLPFDQRAEANLRPPPRLGEHTAQVLREAGCADDDIAALTKNHSPFNRTER